MNPHPGAPHPTSPVGEVIRKFVAAAAIVLMLASPAVGWVELEFPESGMRLRKLAGETAGVAWQVEEVVLRGVVRRSDSVRGAMRFEGNGITLRDDARGLVAQGLRATGAIEIDELTDTAGRGVVELRLIAGELLVDRFYIDLSQHPVKLAAAVDVPLAAEPVAGARLSFSNGEMAMGGVGVVRAGGWIGLDGAAMDLDAVVEIDGVARLYEMAVVEPFAASLPWLVDTRVAGTVLGEVGYRLEANGEYRLDGELRVRDGELVGPEPDLQFGGVQAAVPFEVGTAPAAAAATSRRGVIEIGGGALLGIEIRSLSLPIVASEDSLALAAPTDIPLLDGSIHLREAAAAQLIDAERSVTVSLDLKDVALAPLAEGFGLPPLRGRLSGSIPRIAIQSGELTTNGEIVADVFNGRIVARNLRGRELGTAVPSFGLDVELDGISLGELTGAFAFGDVSGVARGAVTGLELVAWGPVAFDARLESVPVSGVPQKLSVDAIRQISIVGGGGGDPLSQGVMTFFDEYRYSKLGFQCSLRNDQFEIDGIEIKGDKHYLVVGATLPPRVDVVLYNRRIAFSDMLARIEAVLASAAAEAEKASAAEEPVAAEEPAPPEE